MLNICVPVLKRYDLFFDLFESLGESTLRPDKIYVINNGTGRIFQDPLIECYTPPTPLGVAASWNWFIANVPADRVISNDDITFAQDSLARMQECPAALVTCGFGFSCFLLRDSCIETVGLFDEELSPGYAYFEDLDYLRRIQLQGIPDVVVECGVQHRQSSTPQHYTSAEIVEHNRKFELSRANYTAKWGKPDWGQLRAIGGHGAAVD